MTVFDDLHVRGVYAEGKTLYLTEDEKAELDAASFDPAAFGWKIEVDDTKAATQAKAAAKAYVPPTEPDPPGVTI
jgi:hypothetical protein